ncbi:MAG: ThiF family adenylyltransferase [Planctomycetota bacterium]|nr:ThiF family adenylyltransferase [Planctomycetota bacterium]
MAFGLAYQATTGEGTLFLVNELILPDKADLSEQSAGGVCPTRQFQSYVYFRAQQTGTSIVEFHTHPGAGVPRFSGIDEAYAHPNAEYIGRKLRESATLVMIVGNNRFDSFDGVVYDRQLQQFRQLDRLEFLGRPSEIRPIGEAAHQPSDGRGGMFDRQQRIPGWNQLCLERERVGIFGGGGNGATLFETLIGIGVGRQGFIVMVDDDLIEESNLPRIPYAFTEHTGTPKVAVAVQYAGRKSPSTPVFAFPCRFNEQPVLDRMKMATVLFYCGDNDGGRKEANAFAVQYCIPLIEMGCDIQVTEKTVIAGGQVRVVLPGQNACLVCCRGFDPSQAAIDQMDDASRAGRAARGYVEGTRASATPSVANLNVLTAQFAVSQFLALVNGDTFAQWDYLHFDQFTGRTITARTTRCDGCPLCGHMGCLAKGDVMEKPETSQSPIRRLELET